MISHFGLCVSNLERSLRFYTHALGFTEKKRLYVSGPIPAKLLGTDELELKAVFLIDGSTTPELLEYAKPPLTPGATPPRPMAQLGLSQLSFRVSDVLATCRAIVQDGGTILGDTRVAGAGGDALFALDPDGTRIEIIGSRKK